jgi:dTDP-4-dehydrorhamnose reductase
VDKFLVVGVDTVAGANLAVTFAKQHHVSTWSSRDGHDLPNCHALDPADAPRAIVAKCRPDWVIYCGPAARSSWDPAAKAMITDDAVAAAHEWALAAAESGSRLCMISSDALFAGPWMFHDEESHALCGSYQSQVIRAAELQIQEHCPEALIIRTNVFGWSPEQGAGWIETILAEIETKRIVQQDHIRHATPILATDLAEIIQRACQEKLSGMYHVGGAERVSPLKFAQRLADLFDLPWLAMRRETSLNETPQGFGEGECSLQTKKIRKDLCVAMPLLSEGLARLSEQASSGFRDQLSAPAPRRQQRRAA